MYICQPNKINGLSKEKTEEKSKKIDKASFKKSLRIFRYMSPYKWQYIFGLFFLVLTSLVFLVFTQLIRYLVDSTGDSSAMEQSQITDAIPNNWDMTDIGLILGAVLIGQAFFSFFRVWLFVSTTENALADLRQDVYKNLIRLPMLYFNKKQVGELSSRLSSDISQIQETLTTTLAEFLRQTIIILGGIGMMVVTSAKLTGIMLGVLPLIAIAAVIFGRFIRKLSRTAQDNIAESVTIVQESISGIANVKSFTNEAFEINRFTKSVAEIRKVALKGGAWRGAFASFIILCIFGAIVGVVWYSMYMVENGELSAGKMTQFILLCVVIGFSFGGLTEIYASIQKAIGATERVFEIIDEEGEEVDTENENKSQLARLNGSIEFKNLSFSYPTREEITVLNNISFKAEPGQHIAVVGPSGAGKSTLTSLLFRFYHPTSGEILIDNKPIQDYSLTELRNQMAIVPQDVMLFGGSIRENIAYGKPDATDAEVAEAAEKANAKEFIEKFPEKYDTLVGERGVQLSGGQRQRIAIARAVLKDPSILILDEATSSLDSESEKLVQNALEKLMEGRTSIVIAHRLSTIRKADKILVLENGEIKEVGTHDELIAIESGIYRNLSTLQFELS